MKRFSYLLSGSLFLLVFSTAVSALEPLLPAYSQHYDVSRDPGNDAVAALKLATESNRLVLIEVGGDWCSWCHVLDRFIQQHPGLNAHLREVFVVLKVNVSDDNDNARFMASMPPVLGYPHMYISDAKGNILHSQDTAEFLDGKQYSEQKFTAFLNRWQARL